jgi:hypothetical protein
MNQLKQWNSKMGQPTKKHSITIFGELITYSMRWIHLRGGTPTGYMGERKDMIKSWEAVSADGVLISEEDTKKELVEDLKNINSYDELMKRINEGVKAD